MAFNSKNFSVMAYANGFTLWHYASEDDLDTIMTCGYFNPTSVYARKGDMFLVSANKEAKLQSSILVINDIVNGVVCVQSLN